MEYRRTIVKGAVYFFTLNLRDRKSDLLIKEIDKLRLAFNKVIRKHPFKIEGIVILPDHLHFMFKLPSNDGDYPLRIRLIKSAFTHQIEGNEYTNPSRDKKKERGIWQRRYWEHLIRDERDFESHLNYIYYNPVKHGYVKRVINWPYSSIHRDIKLGIFPVNWACELDFKNGQFGE